MSSPNHGASSHPPASHPSQHHPRYQQYTHPQPRVHYRAGSSESPSQVEIRQRHAVQPVPTHSSSSHYRPSPSDRQYRREFSGSSTRPRRESPSYLSNGAAASYPTSHHAPLREGNIQILSIPQYAQSTRTPTQVAFPPPGATIQSIQSISPSQQITLTSMASHPAFTQRHATAAHHASSPQEHAPTIDPNIKFLHAPPGVTIPPQSFPSYQVRGSYEYGGAAIITKCLG